VNGALPFPVASPQVLQTCRPSTSVLKAVSWTATCRADGSSAGSGMFLPGAQVPAVSTAGIQRRRGRSPIRHRAVTPFRARGRVMAP
jgi:hypothetical protein